jgi:fructose-bisphosphate aldolase, class II
MSLISLRELLVDSKKKKYGVFATNAFTFEMAQTVIQAAVEKNSPVILMIAEDLFSFLDPRVVAPYLLHLIDEVKVPVVFHLDHGNNFDLVVKSLDFGFNSVMFDGSNLPLKKNIEMIKKLKNLAKPKNINVEGEVGRVGGLEAKDKDISLQQIDADDFTKIDDAVEFVSKTDVDALAVAVGTIHGKFRFKPHLDFERIKNLRDAVDAPLVLHGGSGLSEEDFKKAIECGITKINFFTGLVNVSIEKTKELVSDNNFTFITLNKKVMESVKEEVKRMMDVFGSTGRG